MTESLEEGVRRLEAFRYGVLGLLNAHTRLLTDLWCNVVTSADPKHVLSTLHNCVTG
jgi:hypothetical protein